MVYLHPALLQGLIYLAPLLPPAVQAPAPDPIVTGVTVTPSVVLLAGAAEVQLNAVVAEPDAPQGVTWELSPALGTISSGGRYVAPAATGLVRRVIAKATSQADPDFSDTATITLLALPRVVNVTIQARDQQGHPMAEANVIATLDKDDVDEVIGYVSREQITGTTDEYGILVMTLWPNALGTLGSRYKFKIYNPDTGRPMRITASIPNEDCFLHKVALAPE